jgi:hypothetical protein
MIGRAILALLVVMISNLAAAQSGVTESVGWSLQGCRDFLAAGSAVPFKQGYCGGVVSSLMIVGRDLSPALRFCIGEGVTVEQAVRVVVAYLERRPTLVREPFQPLVREALREAWPCR